MDAEVACFKSIGLILIMNSLARNENHCILAFLSKILDNSCKKYDLKNRQGNYHLFIYLFIYLKLYVSNVKVRMVLRRNSSY